MELQEYLTQTKSRRVMLVRQASKYLKKVMDNDANINSDDSHNESIYSGPQPLKLKVYENSVNTQLQKIYRIGFETTTNERADFNAKVTIDERIRRVYGKDSKVLDKKQLTIIPKNDHIKNIKNILPIKQTRFMSSSPYLKGIIKNREISLNKSKKNVSLPTISNKTAKRNLANI